MTAEWWFQLVKEGGAYCAVLELAAIWWLLKQLATRDADCRSLSAKLESLSERTIVLLTKLEALVTGRKDAL